MKSYTTLEQSKKLAEILPIESADMFLALDGTLPVMSKYIDDGFVTADNTAVPCWSLAALLKVLPHSLDDRYTLQLGYPPGDGDWYIMYVDTSGFIKSPAVVHSNLIDACVEMIVKLKEKDLL